MHTFNDFCGVVFTSKFFKFVFVDIKLVKLLKISKSHWNIFNVMKFSCIQIKNLTEDIHLANKHSTYKEIGNFGQVLNFQTTGW